MLRLSLLGLVVGALTGALMVLMTWLLRWAQLYLLDGQDSYTALEPLQRVGLLFAGGLAVGLLLRSLPPAWRQVGVPHVLEHLLRGDARLSWRNGVVQFFVALLCLASGHSMGRAGPAVHIGASSASWVGQRLHLSHNHLRILLGCGAAGAISAVFNTPLAGVIFAMEVVLQEYTVVGFLPVILAAGSAAVVHHLVLGNTPYLDLAALEVDTGMVLLLGVMLLGVCSGAVGALFVRLVVVFQRLGQGRDVLWRMLVASALTALIACYVPQVMGLGQDVIRIALEAEDGLAVLLLILLAKIVATAGSVAMGMPGGVIGPTLVIGIVLGAVLSTLPPWSMSDHTLFALLGMAAAMAAVLNAPLAALTAILELTGQPALIMPGMLAVAFASLTCHQLLGTPSIFAVLVALRGLRYDPDPVAQHLSHYAVSETMNARLLALPRQCDSPALATLEDADWCCLREEGRDYMLPARALQLIPHLCRQHGTVDLLTIGLDWQEVERVDVRATLMQAISETQGAWLGVEAGGKLVGVLDRRRVEREFLVERNQAAIRDP